MYPRLASNSYVEKEKLELLISFLSPKSWFISGIVNNKCHFEPSGCTSGNLESLGVSSRPTAVLQRTRLSSVFGLWRRSRSVGEMH